MRKIFKGTPAELESAYLKLQASGLVDPKHELPAGPRGLKWEKGVALRAGSMGAEILDVHTDYPQQDVVTVHELAEETKRMMAVDDTHRRLREFSTWAKGMWPDREMRMRVMLSVFD